MPVRSTLPSPSGQPSPSASRRATMKCMFATVNEYISRRKASSPVQRQMSATALGNLAVSSVLPGVCERAEEDRAVADDLVDHLAAVAVELQADVAQRAHVVLDRRELAERDGREGGVLAVGREQPRVVGEAGGEPARVVDRADRRGEA